MSNFILVNDEEKKDIVKVEVSTSVNLSNGSLKKTKVKNVKIYDQNALSSFAISEIKKLYTELKNDIDDEDSDSGYEDIISRFDYILGLLKFKYNRLIEKEKREALINKIYNERNIFCNQSCLYTYEEEERSSRR